MSCHTESMEGSRPYTELIAGRIRVPDQKFKAWGVTEKLDCDLRSRLQEEDRDRRSRLQEEYPGSAIPAAGRISGISDPGYRKKTGIKDPGYKRWH